MRTVADPFLPVFNGTGLCATVALAGGTYVFRDGTGAIVATITEMQPGVPFSDATVACDGSETVVPGSPDSEPSVHDHSGG